jgi:protein TonB
VDYKGKVTEANVISGIGHGCDEEALRIVRSLVFKLPVDGKIKSKYTRKLHIHFRLPGSPEILPSTKKLGATTGGFQITYEVTVKPVTAAAVKKPQSSSYQINLPLPPHDKS